MSRWLILLLSLPLSAVAAEPAQLGRLFLSPGERAALDVVRQNSRPPERIITPGADGEDEEVVDAPAAALPVVTVHGYVKRSDGKGTVWINGQPVQEKSATKNVEIGRLQGGANEVQVKLPSTGQTVKLKAGQSYDPASGKVGSLREITPVMQTSPAEKPASVKPPDDEPEKDSASSANTPIPVDKAAGSAAPATRPPAR